MELMGEVVDLLVWVVVEVEEGGVWWVVWLVWR